MKGRAGRAHKPPTLRGKGALGRMGWLGMGAAGTPCAPHGGRFHTAGHPSGSRCSPGALRASRQIFPALDMPWRQRRNGCCSLSSLIAFSCRLNKEQGLNNVRGGEEGKKHLNKNKLKEGAEKLPVVPSRVTTRSRQQRLPGFLFFLQICFEF